MTAIKARFTLPHGASLCVSQGNIVKFRGDAIVNAADHKCIYGKGVDGAINAAGGPALLAARRALPIVPGTSETRCPVGEARWTIAGNLRDLKGVIHTVGPNFNPKAQWVQKVVSNGDDLLYNAYASSMKVAKANNCKTVAFSLLSAGFFRGSKPMQDVLTIACRALRDHAYDGLQEAHLLAFGQPNAPETNDCQALIRAASSIGLKRGGSGSGAAATASSSSSIAACFASASSSSTASSSSNPQPRPRPAAATTAAAPAAAPAPAPSKTVIEISDGETEEDEVEEVPGPVAKKARH